MQEPPRRSWVPWACAALSVPIQLAGAGRYGYFRDEFYYLECASHLAWGYVDHPPLSLAVLSAERAVLGTSLLALRAPAILAGAVDVVLIGALVVLLGGGRFAQAVACLALALAPVHLAITSFYSMNAFDLVFWTLCVLVLAGRIRTGDGRLWLLFGLVAGLGLLNKYSVGFLGFGLLVGLLLTPLRGDLRERWPWLGALIAVVLFLPHLLWQVAQDWPTLEFLRNAALYKNAQRPPLAFVAGQLLQMNPAAAPVWIGGLGALLFWRPMRPFRVLGLAYVALLVLFAVQNAKDYYLAPAYGMLLAAGGVAAERLLAARRKARVAVIGVLAATGAAAVPLVVPLLPVESFLRYQAALGLQPQAQERSALGPLPQHFADRFGWPEMVRDVAGVLRSLPEPEREAVVIVTGNYGEAGAINFFGPALGLPRAVSGHNNYWLWGPGEQPGSVLVVVGASREELEPYCGELVEAALLRHPYAMPYENRPIFVCRSPRSSLQQVWPQTKHYL